MFCSIPNPTIVIITDVPPALIKGRGIPVAGIVPMFVPIFTNTSSSSFTPKPADISESIVLFAVFTAVRRHMIMSQQYTPIRNIEPMSPNSSAKEANMKSV